MNRRVLATLALVLGVAALVPPHAAACLCGGRSDEPAIPGEVAFVGVVAARDEPNLLTLLDPRASGSSVLYTFAVEEVMKGDIGGFVNIRSGMGGGDCGLQMAVGDRWRIYASRFDGEYWVSSCGPSQQMAAGVPAPPVPGRVDPLLLIALAAVGALAFTAVKRRGSRQEPAEPAA